MLFEPYLLWADPCVIAYQRDDARCLELLLARAPKGASILLHCPGHDGRRFFAHVAALQRSHPSKRFHLMANTRLELREYEDAFSLPARYGPVSLFTDERVFDVRPERAKDTTAIYVARFHPGVREHAKRLLLASEVRSLRVVTCCLGRRHGFREAFYATYPELRHASVNDTLLLPPFVAGEMQRARVQLALSRREGCMLAFSEALLCGVPGVSTRCRSARTEFFNDLDVALCEDDARDVARAVSQMSERSTDGTAVRARALNRLHAMRQEYVDYLATLTGAPEGALMEHLFGHPDGALRLSFCLPRPPESAGRALRHGTRGVPFRWRSGEKP